MLTRAGDAIQVSSLTEGAERDPDQWVIRLNSGCTAFSSPRSIFSCCTSVGTTGCHPGAIEISGRVACSSDGRLSFDRGGYGRLCYDVSQVGGLLRVGAREA